MESTIEKTSTLHQYAIEYAEAGIRVFPVHGIVEGKCTCRKETCNEPGKHPATEHGFKDATTDLDRINEWWAKNPDYNIAAPTGAINGFFVVDQDGPAGTEAIERLSRRHEGYSWKHSLLSNVKSGTPRAGGGTHTYFKYEPQKYPPKLAEGLDVRSDGNYIILPPSRHRNGGREYFWIDDKSLLDNDPQNAPEWLLQECERNITEKNRSGTGDMGADIPEGTRNNTLTSIAGKYRRDGMGYEVIRQMLHIVNENQCKPPLPTDEVDCIAESVSRYEAGKLPTSNGKPSKTITAADLVNKEFSPMKWAVPDILPEGLTLLAGKPKMGKSWLALGICLAVASGGVALGTRAVEAGEVLYMALEDNQRRLQTRLRDMRVEDYPDTLHIATEWNNADNDGAKELDEWLTDHPDCRLVVVDTIKRFRTSKRAGKNAYDVEYDDLAPLLKLTHKHSTSILVVTHFRKDTEVDDPYDAVSGSTGLTGAVDGVMLLQRERGAADAFLYVDGRDIEDTQDYALRWDSRINNWCIQGDAPKYKMSPERREIVEFLEQKNATGPITAIGPRDIARELAKNESTLKNTLVKMVPDQVNKTQGGKYYVDSIDYIDSVDPVDSVDRDWFE